MVAVYIGPGLGTSASAAEASTTVAARVMFDGTGIYGVPATGATAIVWVRNGDSLSATNDYFRVSDGPADLIPSFKLANLLTGEDVASCVLRSDIDETYPRVGDAGARGETSEWAMHAVVINATHVTCYGNGELNTTVGPSIALAGRFFAASDTVRFFSGGLCRGAVCNPAFFARNLSQDELRALYDAGPDHLITAPHTSAGGNVWAGENAVVNWIAEPIAGSVANSGTGGVCALALGADMSAVASVAAASAVPRIGALGVYPPTLASYRTSGTAGSFFRALGSRMSRLLFPAGGGIGNFTLHWWLRRPLTPAVTEGAVVQIGAGDATLTVSTVTGGANLAVNVNDGTIDVQDDTAAPLSGFSWVAVAVVHDTSTDDLTVYFNGTSAFVLDLSTLTVPAADTELTFTLGANGDGTDALDAEFSAVAGFDEALTPTQVEALFQRGWTFDPRSEPTLPAPPVLWVDGLVDGVVPSAITDGDPLVPFSAEVDVEASERRAWFMGDHRIGAFSTAWWDESAHDPDDWGLAFGDAAVFGECPRIVNITPREDGALLLDLDARARPGIYYQVTSPVDLSGNDLQDDIAGPYPTLLHTAPTVPALLDIDAPVVPASGFTLAASGDYKLSGETKTVEKMIWAALLTPAGSLDWDPDFGSALRLRRLRPSDLAAERRRIVQLVEAIPHVSSASVQLLFDGDEMTVDVTAVTNFGTISTSRPAR